MSIHEFKQLIQATAFLSKAQKTVLTEIGIQLTPEQIERIALFLEQSNNELKEMGMKQSDERSAKAKQFIQTIKTIKKDQLKEIEKVDQEGNETELDNLLNQLDVI